MKIVILKDLVKNSSSVEEGKLLFSVLKSEFLNENTLLLEVDSELSLSSSFLNSSIGAFLDEYGFENLKNTVQIKGSKTQFQKLNTYIKSYRDLYLA